MCYTKYATTEPLIVVHNSILYFLTQEDIIKVGLYLLSCLQKIPCDELWTSLAAYEKGIFHGCRLARAAFFFMNLIVEGKEPLGNNTRCFHGSFIFLEVDYAK